MSAGSTPRMILLAAASLAFAAGISGCAPWRPFASQAPKVTAAAAASAAAPGKTGKTPDIRQASGEEEEERKEKDITDYLSELSPNHIEGTLKRLTGNGPNHAIARQMYEEGEVDYRRAVAAEGAERTRLFLEAARKFTLAAEKWPGSAVEQDALFMTGESYFFSDYYWKANTYYEKLLKAHPGNAYLDKVDARRYAIAKYWLDTNRESPEPLYYVNIYNQQKPTRDIRGHGLRIFGKIPIDDPTGRLADDAILAAANEQFAARKFLKADELYTDLRKNYPASEHQFLAHFLGLKSKLNTYLGSEYAAAPLDESEKLIKQIRRQFPLEAEKERPYLDRVAAEIRFKKAERLWDRGQFYDGRGEYRGAAHNYQQVVKDYNDTPFALKAEERLTKIQDLPPVPAQKLPWLVALLPKSDKIAPLVASVKKQKEEENLQIARQPPQTGDAATKQR